MIKNPKVIVGIPSGITEVEERAVEEVMIEAGAKRSLFNRRTNGISNWSKLTSIRTNWKYYCRYWSRYNRSCELFH